MFPFFLILFTLMLFGGIALIGLGWYRKGTEELEEEERLQKQETSRAANPGTTDPMTHLRKKAEEGDARSQFEYGMMLIRESEACGETNPEGEKLYSFGIAWVKMAAKQSYGPALLYCGDDNKVLASACYQKQDMEKFITYSEIALRYYHRAIEIGYPRALAILDEIDRASERVETLKRERAGKTAGSYQWTEGGCAE